MQARGRVGLLLAALVVVASCRATVVASGTRPPIEPDARGRLPAAAFFRSPQLSHLSLSPDGRHIAAILERDGLEMVVERPTAGGEIRALAKVERRTTRTSRQIRTLGWPSNDRVIVSVEEPFRHAGGVNARRTRLLSVPLDGSRPGYLGEKWRHQQYSQSQDQIISWLPNEPNHLLLNWWAPGKRSASAARVNVVNGVMRSAVRARPDSVSWAADSAGRVRAGTGASRRGTTLSLYARARVEDDFERIAEYDAFEEEGIDFAGFSEIPEQIYVWSSAETGRSALYRYDLATRKLGEKVFGHPEVDVGWTIHSPLDDRLLAVGYASDRPRAFFLDAREKQLAAALDQQSPDSVHRIVSSDATGTRVIVVSSGDTTPPSYAVGNRETGRVVHLLDSYPELESVRLAPMHPVRFEARDGLVIHGYLTLPPGITEAAAQNLPSILLPHGGPTSRDDWGWNPEVQFLASRGFAVLQPNFRGSTGYGTEHTKKGYRQWGLAMQDDLTDAAHWLIDRGIADPDRIGIYGASYGGYAALMGLVKTPDLFSAGASFAGVSDLIVWLDDIERYSLFADFNSPVHGDVDDDRGQLKQTSPAHFADRIRVPVLIAHGTEDPMVHVGQAHRMIDALEKAGGEVESYLYDGEVHGFIDERNRIHFYEALAAFFARHLAAPPAQ